MKIHSTAVVSPRAVVHSSVEIGPFAIVEPDAVIGQGCKLYGRSTVKSHTMLGRDVVVGEGAVLGGMPQHISPPEHPGRVIVGERTVVHQHVRIGRLAMIGACARVVQDVPPFVLTDGNSGMIVGLNKVGLRRAGMERDETMQLKEAYRLIYRHGLPFEEMVEALQRTYASGPATEFAEFFHGSKRGFVQERRSPPKAAIRLHPNADDLADDDAADLKRLAG